MRRGILALALLAVLVLAAGFVWSLVVARQIEQALGTQVDLGGGASLEPGRVETSVGFFSTEARLVESRVVFQGGLAEVPASTITVEGGVLVGRSAAAVIRLDALPELVTRLEDVTYRIPLRGGRPDVRATARRAEVQGGPVAGTAHDLALTLEARDAARRSRLALTLVRAEVTSPEAGGLRLAIDRASWTERHEPRDASRLAVGAEAALAGLALEAAAPPAGRLAIAEATLTADLEVDATEATPFGTALGGLVGSVDRSGALARRLQPRLGGLRGRLTGVRGTTGETSIVLAAASLDSADRAKGALVEQVTTGELAGLEVTGAAGFASLERARMASEWTRSLAHERTVFDALATGAPATPDQVQPALVVALLDYVISSGGKSDATLEGLVLRLGRGAPPLARVDGTMESEAGFADGVGAFAIHPRLRASGLRGAGGLPIPVPVDQVDAGLRFAVRRLDLGSVRTLVARSAAPAGPALADAAVGAVLGTGPGIELECVVDTDSGVGVTLRAALDLAPAPPAAWTGVTTGGSAALTGRVVGTGTFRLHAAIRQYRKILEVLDLLQGPGAGEGWLRQAQEYFRPLGRDLVADLVVRGGKAQLNGRPSPAVDALLQGLLRPQ